MDLEEHVESAQLITRLAKAMRKRYPELRDLTKAPKRVVIKEIAKELKVSLDVAISAAYVAVFPDTQPTAQVSERQIPKINKAIRRAHGLTIYEKGAGFHRLGSAERSAVAHEANRESLKSKGIAPWYDEYPLEEGSESLYAFRRTLDAKLYCEGPKKRRLLAQKIADEVNAKFHHDRTAKNVKQFFYHNRNVWQEYQRAQGAPFTPHMARRTRSEARMKQLRKQGFYSWNEHSPDGMTYREHAFLLACQPEYQKGIRHHARKIAATLNDLYGINCDADAVSDMFARSKQELIEFKNEYHSKTA